MQTQLNQLNREEPAKLQRTDGISVTYSLELTNGKQIKLTQENPSKNLKRKIRNH